MKQGRKVIAVLPAYNEAKHVGRVVKRALMFTRAVVLVDDGSTDDTAGRGLRAGAIVLSCRVNSGKGHALRIGTKKAMDMGADIVVTLDADSQHLPEEIPKLIAPLIHGRADLTIGTRFPYRYYRSRRVPSVRWASNRLSTFLVRHAAGLRPEQLSDSQCGFRAFTAKSLSVLDLNSERYNVETETIIKATRLGLLILQVPIACIYSPRLGSKFKASRDIPMFLLMIIRSFLHRGRRTEVKPYEAAPSSDEQMN